MTVFSHSPGLLSVRVTGLEPARREAIDPKSIVSASFTTPAYSNFYPLYLTENEKSYILSETYDTFYLFKSH